MIVSIMQPYFFPYIGYFQLIAASDAFVLYDDVQYMKGGWINRNRVLLNGAPEWITIPVKRASYKLPINARHYQIDQRTVESILGQIDAAYRKAPNYEATRALIVDVLKYQDSNVATFNENLVRNTCSHMGIDTRISTSSSMVLSGDLKGQERVLRICGMMGATCYLNPSGGVSLYQKEAFSAKGLELRFLKPTDVSYPQLGAAVVPNLSIIDVLMFNDTETIKRFLRSE